MDCPVFSAPPADQDDLFSAFTRFAQIWSVPAGNQKSFAEWAPDSSFWPLLPPLLRRWFDFRSQYADLWVQASWRLERGLGPEANVFQFYTWFNADFYIKGRSLKRPATDRNETLYALSLEDMSADPPVYDSSFEVIEESLSHFLLKTFLIDSQLPAVQYFSTRVEMTSELLNHLECTLHRCCISSSWAYGSESYAFEGSGIMVDVAADVMHVAVKAEEHLDILGTELLSVLQPVNDRFFDLR